jgi:hypothetical protein
MPASSDGAKPRKWGLSSRDEGCNVWGQLRSCAYPLKAMKARQRPARSKPNKHTAEGATLRCRHRILGGKSAYPSRVRNVRVPSDNDGDQGRVVGCKEGRAGEDCAYIVDLPRVLRFLPLYQLQQVEIVPVPRLELLLTGPRTTPPHLKKQIEESE